MKLNAKKIALAAFAVVGMISTIGCKKVEEEVKTITTKNPDGFLVGVWNCTDSRYTQTGNLQLVFKDDFVIGTNSTGQQSLFDSLNSPYEYSDDYLYINGVKEDSVTVFSENEIKISFLGGIIAELGAPSGEYNFSRIGGSQ